MRRRITYANVAATLALVLAMSGGALAASHYLINSTGQINPNVLKQLKGARGPRGAQGPRGTPQINSIHQINPHVLKQLRGARGPRGVPGPNGVVGPQGVQGLPGHQGSKGQQGERGPSALTVASGGETESGDFALSVPEAEGGATYSTGVTFEVPLPAGASNVFFLAPGAHEGSCPGVGQAARGTLCLYENAAVNLGAPVASDPETDPPVSGESGRFGAVLSFPAAAPGALSVAGTYSVTAK